MICQLIGSPSKDAYNPKWSQDLKRKKHCTLRFKHILGAKFSFIRLLEATKERESSIHTFNTTSLIYMQPKNAKT